MRRERRNGGRKRKLNTRTPRYKNEEIELENLLKRIKSKYFLSFID